MFSKTFLKKLSKKNFPEKNFSKKNFRQRLLRKQIPEKNLEQNSGNYFQITFWIFSPQNSFSDKTFMKTFPKKTI